MSGKISLALAVVAAIAFAVIVLRAPVPPPVEPSPPAPTVEVELPPLPADLPAHLPAQTAYQKTFLRIREQYITDPRGVLGKGTATRFMDTSPDESVALLKASALKDPNDRFRAWSVTQLGNMKRSELAEEVFVHCLREDRFFGARAAAAGALGQAGSRRHAGVLEEAARSDPDALVRQYAEEALRKIEGGTIQ